ncbi:hypothetical protein Rsub_07216 [Raphidocelis subcapitata]|uniref:Ig-like domain-containing protein n=1 Tax=Raphidocelis subcapitata TaxID=307507 RepID=A0A2V0P648_9CHLO|nr:hypothetical protein Rsub_07216 [Raphidocelis subcapitata]|eukprot:GBF94402.1 hypothetical protein Rsub_07216 [Raphidocelis subcapitata]
MMDVSSGPRTVRYVTQDPIQNLRIRVTLTRLSASTRGKAAARTQHAAAKRDDAAPPADNGAADGAAPAAVAEAPQPPPREQQQQQQQQQQPLARCRPPAAQASRVFGWQEKVPSRAERTAALEQQRARAASPAGQRAAAVDVRAARLGPRARGDAAAAAGGGGGAGDGSGSGGEDGGGGGLLFTYVHTEPFCEAAETAKTVTTSGGEGRNHLMLNFWSMYIMADLGEEGSPAGSSEKVLVALRAYPDGSFDMAPGFSGPGRRYRFEDEHGGIYEYTVENASHTEAPSLERRVTKLGAALLGRAVGPRAGGGAFAGGLGGLSGAAGPPQGGLRLALCGEIVSGAGFDRDRLYVEWRLTFDPAVWTLAAPAGQPGGLEQPAAGVLAGVTQVSKAVCYPEDPSSSTPPLWVAHWAHPIEAEWVARAAPPPGRWPVLTLQVCSYDNWDRYTCEGYGWTQLDASPGSAARCVQTWKPLGTRRDRQQEFFIGGSLELADPSYVALKAPSEAAGGAPLGAILGGGGRGRAGGAPGVNKYGFQTVSSGRVKLRLHCLQQLGDGAAAAAAAAASSAASPPRGGRDAGGGPQRPRRELSLAVVLERARARLEDARAGGGGVVVRPGLAAAPPFVRRQPEDAAVDEGATVQFSVVAGGAEPLAYRWLKDGRRLRVATADSADLILVGVAPADAGQYQCKVSNGDGEASSARAVLTVRRLSRLQRVAGAGAGAGAAAASPPPGNALNWRQTVPRTLARGGGGLPYNPRAGAGLSPLPGWGGSNAGGAAAATQGEAASPALQRWGRRREGWGGSLAGSRVATPLPLGGSQAGGSAAPSPQPLSPGQQRASAPGERPRPLSAGWMQAASVSSPGGDFGSSSPRAVAQRGSDAGPGADSAAADARAASAAGGDGVEAFGTEVEELPAAATQGGGGKAVFAAAEAAGSPAAEAEGGLSRRGSGASRRVRVSDAT